MSEFEIPLVGVGLYSPAEAARLTRIPARNIRRWLLGYRYRNRYGDFRGVPPVIRADFLEINHTAVLSFLDMMELRMVHTFRNSGLSWQGIREAVHRACDLFETSHPFTLRRFRTDGRRIFADLMDDNEVKLLDLNTDHFVFNEIVEPSLYEGIEFEQGQAARWFPQGTRKMVVIDPTRSFGQPILAREGIPTEILAGAARVEGSAADAAKWYDVPVAAIKAAVAYEEQLAA